MPVQQSRSRVGAVEAAPHRATPIAHGLTKAFLLAAILPEIETSGTPLSHTSWAIALRWIALGGLAGVGAASALRRKGQVAVTPATALWFGFGVFAVASTLYSPNPVQTGLKAASFVMLLVACFLGLSQDRDARWYADYLSKVLVVVLALTAVGVVLHLGAVDASRLRGPFRNPNALGSIVALTFPAAVLRARSAPTSRARLLWMVVVAASFLTVYETKSRAALVTLLVAALVVEIAVSGTRLLLVLLGLGVAVALAPTSITGLTDNVVYKGSSSSTSFAARSRQLSQTWQAAKTQPIAGNGFGVSAGDDVRSTSLLRSAGREKGNSFLGVVEELGVTGLLLLLVPAAVLAVGSLRVLRQLGSRDPTVVLIAIFMAGLVHTNFEAWFTSAGAMEGAIFWTTTGLLVGQVRYRPRRFSLRP